MELHVAGPAIRVGLLMVIVMISTIILIVTLMVEIAVDGSTLNTARNVNALNKERKTRIQ